MTVFNALDLAWKARQRLWARKMNANGQRLGALTRLTREEMDSHLQNIIFAIEEERQERHTEALFDVLEEAGLIEKAEQKLEKVAGAGEIEKDPDVE